MQFEEYNGTQHSKISTNMIATLKQKTPAWVKAIALTILLLLPILILNQASVQLNLVYLPNFPIAALIVPLLLFIYWKLCANWKLFTDTNDIALGFDRKSGSLSSIRRYVGLMIFIYAFISLFALLFNIDTTNQVEMIASFQEYSPTTAIPLLFAMALSAGVVEEITFRAFVQNALSRSYSRLITYAFAGFLFSIFHFLPLALIFPYMVVAMAFAWVADQDKSIGGLVIVHTLYDFILFLFIYFGSYPLLSKEFTLGNIGLHLILISISIWLLSFKKTTTVRTFSKEAVSL